MAMLRHGPGYRFGCSWFPDEEGTETRRSTWATSHRRCQVAVGSPMRRGLKQESDAVEAREALNVAVGSPMRRGLKPQDEPTVARCASGCSWLPDEEGTETKHHLLLLLRGLLHSCSWFPDEEGTETRQ